MSDLARLGLRVESEEVATADERLDDFAASAVHAEKAADGLAGGSKRASSAMAEMTRAMQKDVVEMNALAKATDGTGASFARTSQRVKAHNDNMKLASHEVVNLGRQFSDVGVQLAGGASPLMVLIQQGPQVADVFQMAASRGVTLRAAIAGLMADLLPLVATLAPWIAGLAAVSAGVFLLVRAHDEHIKRIDAVNTSISDMHKNLSEATPWLFEAANQSNLAAEGTKNFNDWVERNSKSMKGYAAATREATIELARMNVFNAKNSQQKLVDENFKVVGGVPTYNGKGSAWWEFGHITGSLDKGFKEFNENFRKAGENVKATQATLEAMMAAPPEAFLPKEGKARAISQKDKNLAAAKADGRFATGPANDRGVNSIDVKTVDDAQKAIFVSKGGLNDFDPKKIDDHYKSAEDRARAYADFEANLRRERIAAERQMWSDLTSLQYSSNKKLAAVGKAAAIAQATINAYLTISNALKTLPFPLNIAASVAAGAVAFAQVAQIAGVKGFKDGGWTGYGATDSISGVTHGQEFVVKAGPAAANRAMLEAMNAGRPAPPPRPGPPPSANMGGMSVRVIKGDLFDVIVDRRAAAVAAPMAAQARDDGAQTAMAGVADMDRRNNLRRLY